MSDLDDTAERFSRALDEVERAALPLLDLKAAAADSKAQISALAAERDRLNLRIAALERELEAVGGATHEVEARLDTAIEEIKGALKR